MKINETVVKKHHSLVDPIIGQMPPQTEPWLQIIVWPRIVWPSIVTRLKECIKLIITLWVVWWFND